MTAAEIEVGVARALQALPAGAKPHLGHIRREIGCTPGALEKTLDRMRHAGAFKSDRLELAETYELPAAALLPPTRAAAGKPGPMPRARTAAGDADPAAAKNATLLTPGQQLLRDIEAYCVRTGTPEFRIGQQLFRHVGYVGLLRQRGSTTPEKVTAVRALMTEFPDGIEAARTPAAAPAATKVADAVAAEATGAGERRKTARVIGTAVVKRPIGKLSAAETMQSMLIETPADLLRTVERVQRALWDRCILLSRVLGERPAATLYRAIDAGLDMLEADVNESATAEAAS